MSIATTSTPLFATAFQLDAIRLLRRELSGAGRALECHGLGDLSRREIRALLEEGWQASNWFRVIR